MKKHTITLALALLTTVSLSACGQKKTQATKTSANFGLNTEVASMDTLKAQDPNSFDVQAAVFSGLYRMNGQDKVVPDVAKGQPKLSNGNKTYTINLRHNAKWSNGDPVTAQDFVYAWQRGADPKTKSNYAFIIQTVIKNGDRVATGKLSPTKLGVKAVGRYQLKVDLQKPTPYFKSLLTFNPYFPQNKAFEKKVGSKYATSPSTMVYNGPYQLAKYSQGATTISLTRNAKYTGSVTPHLKKLNFHVVKDASTGYDQYQSHKLDMTFLSTNLVKNNKNKAGFKTIPNSMVTYLQFNMRKKSQSPLLNKSLRQALANAIDTKQLAQKVLQDESSPLSGYIPPKFVRNTATGKDFRQEGGQLYVANQHKVAAEWAQAKKALGKQKITLQLLIDDEDWQKTTAEYLQSVLEKNLPGLKISIRSLPQQQELGIAAQGNFQMVLAQWGPDYQDPMTYLGNYTSTPEHTAGYHNSTYDRLIANANGKDVNHAKQRYADFHAAEKLLVKDEQVLVPLNQQVYSVLQQTQLKGVQHHMVGAPFTYATAYWQK
ncbi:peptide ABC transporter substrate-binding protein [Levilactobacillus zymae]|uniref:peptide ABC transporter substrate-binding protein n=1 Tax=Levilactobacillus zymae TaxID=267363 RepID=UPI0028B619DA|nr:peptide ABC transporter substrate-binding protein [Levilactobacillus zymae]MDT6979524.1 peptide ABC transporter substrate-binding protein [Levilactobacillus zymae]